MLKDKKFEIGDIVYVNDVYHVFGDNLQHIVIDIVELQDSSSTIYKLISTQELKQGKINIYESVGEFLWKISE